MANTLRIKRRPSSGLAGAPSPASSLYNGELAFNENDNILYYAYGSGVNGVATSVPAIAGSGAYSLRGGTNASGLWPISVNGNSASVTNGVYTTGNQDVSGNKTFLGTGNFDSSFRAAKGESVYNVIFSPTQIQIGQGDIDVKLAGNSYYDPNGNYDPTKEIANKAYVTSTLSGITFTAGSGLLNGGTLVANRTFDVGQGDGISVSTDAIAVDSTVVRTTGNQTIGGRKTFSTYPIISGNLAGELVFQSTINTNGGNIIFDGVNLGSETSYIKSSTAQMNIAHGSKIQLDSTLEVIAGNTAGNSVGYFAVFDSNPASSLTTLKSVSKDQILDDIGAATSGLTITAGSGLVGGGNLSANRTFDIGQGDGISVSADAIAVDNTVVRTTGVQTISSKKLFASGLSIGANSLGGTELTYIRTLDTSSSTSAIKVHGSGYQTFFDIRNDGNVAIGNVQVSSFDAQLTIKGSTIDSSANALKIIDSSGNNIMLVRNDSNIGIGTATPSAQLHVNGSGIFASGLNIANQTASTIAGFDSNKNVVSLSTSTYPSLTELSYVKGLTSAVQTQINGKAATNQTMYIGTTAVNINRSSASLTLTGITSIDGNAATVTNGVYTTGAQTIAGAKTFTNISVFNSGIQLKGNNVDLNLNSNSISSTDGSSISMTDNMTFTASNTSFNYASSAGEDVSFYDVDTTTDILKITDRISVRSPNGAVSGTYFPVWVSNPSGSAQAISSRTATQLKGDIGLSNVTNDAQIKKLASTSGGFVPTWNGTTGDALNVGYSVETTLTGGAGALPRADAVKTYVDNMIVSGIATNDAMIFKGTINCSTNPNYPAADRGWVYKISVAGRIGGASGPVVEVNDTIICSSDGTPSGTHGGSFIGGTIGDYWNILQTNIVDASILVTGPTSATSGNIAMFAGATGKIIKDGGFLASNIVLTTGNQSISGDKTFNNTIYAKSKLIVGIDDSTSPTNGEVFRIAHNDNGSDLVTINNGTTLAGSYIYLNAITQFNTPSFGSTPLIINPTGYLSTGAITQGYWRGSTIEVNKGGTGQTSYDNGQLLIGNTTGNTLTKATLTQGTAIDITNGGGSITIGHNDTSTLTGAQGSNGIASFTVDGMGHVTAVTTATYLTSGESLCSAFTNSNCTIDGGTF